MLILYSTEPSAAAGPGLFSSGYVKDFAPVTFTMNVPLYASGEFPMIVAFTTDPTLKFEGIESVAKTVPESHEIDCSNIPLGDPIRGTENTNTPESV